MARCLGRMIRGGDEAPTDLVTMAEAARLVGVTRQAVHLAVESDAAGEVQADSVRPGASCSWHGAFLSSDRYLSMDTGLASRLPCRQGPGP
jgi:hypothetical protein